jgi:hypothetical protein
MKMRLSALLVSVIFLTGFMVQFKYTDANTVASTLSPVDGPYRVTAECGTPVPVPSGSQVVRQDGHLAVTFPVGFFVSHIGDDGLPVYGFSEASSVRAETVYDCDCDEGEGGCAEQWNLNEQTITCLMLEECTDCTLTITEGE